MTTTALLGGAIDAFGALVLTIQTIAVWRGDVYWSFKRIDARIPPRTFRFGRRSWFTYLRCVPSACVCCWAALLMLAILFKPTYCSATGCGVVVGVSVMGFVLLIAAGVTLYAVFYFRVPRFAIPPWLRNSGMRDLDDLRETHRVTTPRDTTVP